MEFWKVHYGSAIRFVITIILLALAIWWLYVVLGTMDKFPQTNDAGDVIDQYVRSKDILLVVLPLVTISLGYWFGAAGKMQAEKKAEKAEVVATRAQQQLSGVLDSTTETGLVDKAKEKYPDAFRE